MKGWGSWLLMLLAGGILIAAVASLQNPHLNFPFVSQTICSMKGDTWYDGGILGQPGCYAPSP